MAYLDVGPMVIALRDQPIDFEFSNGWVNHVPSRHRFKFERSGRVWIEAPCDCARLQVDEMQGKQLWEAFQNWTATYWRPLEINREFASHFHEVSPWRRLLRDVRMAWRRFRRGVEQPLAEAKQSTLALASD